MQFSWKNLKTALGEMVTSKQLSEESAKLIQGAVENDTAPSASVPPSAPAPVVVPVAATPSAPVATLPTTPAPAQAATTPVTEPTAQVPAQANENTELEKLRAEVQKLTQENTSLKAKATPGLAAAVPSEDLTQSPKAPSTTETPSAHYEDLKRIKAKFTRFGLSDDINLGDSPE
ncbi:hypothetical protein [Runella zeae]|uniref:hypothetical protein n=1 Tax=Runella zeae TaxID=94255 RepID=UPI002351FAF3|nr:hypothetical protein [Runella zeae]